jgi:3-deoxy-D-manno-octulosonate 8-phosphate phosphatase (KDO 8-P phosphatase)
LEALTKKLRRIKVLLLDVDGVLTAGGIVYDDDGRQIKTFNARDGLGLRLLMDSGITVCLVTGRSSQALRHRCRDLGITHLFEAVGHKQRVLPQITERVGVTADEIAFVGDDLPDVALMMGVGVAIAVGDAEALAREAADLVTTATGGRGAVREVAELLLKAQHRWQAAIERFL